MQKKALATLMKCILIIYGCVDYGHGHGWWISHNLMELQEKTWRYNFFKWVSLSFSIFFLNLRIFSVFSISVYLFFFFLLHHNFFCAFVVRREFSPKREKCFWTLVVAFFRWRVTTCPGSALHFCIYYINQTGLLNQTVSRFLYVEMLSICHLEWDAQAGI